MSFEYCTRVLAAAAADEGCTYLEQLMQSLGLDAEEAVRLCEAVMATVEVSEMGVPSVAGFILGVTLGVGYARANKGGLT